MPPDNDTQIILGELRHLRRELGEISLAIRVDTPWQRVRDNIRYGIETLQLIPMPIRLLLLAGGCLIGYGASTHNLKILTIGVDLVLFSFVVAGTVE